MVVHVHGTDLTYLGARCRANVWAALSMAAQPLLLRKAIEYNFSPLDINRSSILIAMLGLYPFILLQAYAACVSIETSLSQLPKEVAHSHSD